MEKGTIAIFCLLFAIFCMVISFATPYWIESFGESNSRFVKAGLWEFCFNDYTFYKDYNGKRYLGCWYIFSDQYKPIWEWLSPPWFISMQVMVSVSILFQVLTLIITSLAYWRVFHRHPVVGEFIYLAAAAALALTVVLIFIVLVLFGVKKEDRQWMPRPDMNYLSWGYGLCCISGWFSLFSAIFFLAGSRSDFEKEI